MNVLTDRQLVAQVAGWKRKLAKENPTYFGVRTDLEYLGDDSIIVEDETYRVKACRSDLEARELLAEANQATKAILLFRTQHNKLGPDLLARFAARRLLAIDPTAALKELFGVKTIDPRISDHKTLIEALVLKASQGNGNRSAVGVLDADLAWSVLLELPEFSKNRPDLIKLLRMSVNETSWDAIGKLESDIAALFFDWIGERSGSALSYISDAIVQGTDPELLLPIGLCLGPLFKKCQSDEENIRVIARGRLEPYLAGKTIDPESADLWYRAALSACDGLDTSPERALAKKRALAQKVDNLLSALKAEAIAGELQFSLLGIESCFNEYAEALASYLRRKGQNGLIDLCRAQHRLENHGLSQHLEYRTRIEQSRMGARLAVWTKQDDLPALGSSLAAKMQHYFKSSSYTDRALVSIANSDERVDIEKVYEKVRKSAAQIRVEEQLKIAQSVAEWNTAPHDNSILKVEDIIGQLVAPLAKQRKVLLLVLDGMSCSVFSELVEDLTRRDWLTIGRDGKSQAALAAIPSVTAISRKALFSGKIDCEDKRTELVAFRENEALASVSTKAKPKLFLKGTLSEAGNTTLSTEVRNTLEDLNQQVVSILLNVVDDQLSGSDQLKITWEVDKLHFLRQILDSACVGERTVVLVSDHGNVLELNQTQKIGEKLTGGDRYRDDGDLIDSANEVRIEGSRIERATGQRSVVTAATDRIRYSSKKAGYHGGSADMELVIPVAILQKGQDETPDGWDYVDLIAPDWWQWDSDTADSADSTPISRPRKRKVKAPAKTETLNLELFAKDTPEEAEATWVDTLFNSAVFNEQFDSLGRTPLKKPMIRTFMNIMERRKGAAPMVTVAAEMGLPAMRLRGMVAQLRRLFNIDGYEIVAEKAETAHITFDKPMVLKQFAINVEN